MVALVIVRHSNRERIFFDLVPKEVAPTAFPALFYQRQAPSCLFELSQSEQYASHARLGPQETGDSQECAPAISLLLLIAHQERTPVRPDFIRCAKGQE